MSKREKKNRMDVLKREYYYMQFIHKDEHKTIDKVLQNVYKKIDKEKELNKEQKLCVKQYCKLKAMQEYGFDDPTSNMYPEYMKEKNTWGVLKEVSAM